MNPGLDVLNGPPNPVNAQLRFLHLSDAQIRDERLYEASPDELVALESFDWFVNVSIRRPLVERYDALVLAAFLIGAAKGESRPAFAVHTGDLLDISVITELIDGLDALGRIKGEFSLPIYSVPGNHDGLTFGNIPERRTDPAGLGVGLNQFVIGHLLRDPDAGEGFGFGHNEVVESVRQELRKCAPTRRRDGATQRRVGIEQQTALPPGETQQRKSTPDVVVATSDECGDWYRRALGVKRDLARAIRLREELTGHPELAESLRLPIVFRRATAVDQDAGFAGVRLGYYSFRRDITGVPGLRHVRFVALDTRADSGADGSIDGVQLGWLIRELTAALYEHEPVIVFAHHAPDEVRPTDICVDSSRGGCVLRRILDAFPNVIGYLYGHGHVNRNGRRLSARTRFPLIQTGSLADFPQAGRMMELSFSPEQGGQFTADLSWYFVRPSGTLKNADGLMVQSILEASDADADAEYRTTRLRRLEIVRPFLAKFVPQSLTDRIRRQLRPGSEEVKFDFATISDPDRFLGTRRAEIAWTRWILGLAADWGGDDDLKKCPQIVEPCQGS